MTNFVNSPWKDTGVERSKNLEQKMQEKKRRGDHFEFFDGYTEYCDYQRDILGFFRILKGIKKAEQMPEFCNRMVAAKKAAADDIQQKEDASLQYMKDVQNNLVPQNQEYRAEQQSSRAGTKRAADEADDVDETSVKK